MNLLPAIAWVALVAVPQSQGQRQDQNKVPAWATADFARLRHEGLLVGFPDGLDGRGRTPWRSEYAFAVRASIVHIDTILSGFSDELKTGVLRSGDKAHRDDRKVLMEEFTNLESWGPSLSSLNRLAYEFKPELAFLGVDGPKFDKLLELQEGFPARVQNITRQAQFKDVSPDHWAAQAVLELRKLGILDGYPDGTFRG